MAGRPCALAACHQPPAILVKIYPVLPCDSIHYGLHADACCACNTYKHISRRAMPKELLRRKTQGMAGHIVSNPSTISFCPTRPHPQNHIPKCMEQHSAPQGCYTASSHSNHACVSTPEAMQAPMALNQPSLLLFPSLPYCLLLFPSLPLQHSRPQCTSNGSSSPYKMRQKGSHTLYVLRCTELLRTCTNTRNHAATAQPG